MNILFEMIVREANNKICWLVPEEGTSDSEIEKRLREHEIKIEYYIKGAATRIALAEENRILKAQVKSLKKSSVRKSKK